MHGKMSKQMHIWLKESLHGVVLNLISSDQADVLRGVQFLELLFLSCLLVTLTYWL